jgi:hypothetical protein
MAYIVSTKQKHKIGYWESDLRSLGIVPTRKNDLNDEAELQNLADNLKDSMYQDYKTAYGTKGDQFEDEAESTVSV